MMWQMMRIRLVDCRNEKTSTTRRNTPSASIQKKLVVIVYRVSTVSTRHHNCTPLHLITPFKKMKLKWFKCTRTHIQYIPKYESTLSADF